MGIGSMLVGFGSGHSQEFTHYVRIPTSELHSPFDHEYMWRHEKTLMDKPKQECGCYSTRRKDDHGHYTTWATNYHYCPEHYANHLTEEKRKLQGDMERKIRRDTCIENILALAKEKQQEMTDIIKNMTVPFLTDLNDALPDNMYYRNCRCTHNCKCITGCFRNTEMNDHTCTCKYRLSFHVIKYKKIAKKTYTFDMPEPDHCDGTIGTMTIHHCECHRLNWHSDDSFDLKPIESA